MIHIEMKDLESDLHAAISPIARGESLIVSRDGRDFMRITPVLPEPRDRGAGGFAPEALEPGESPGGAGVPLWKLVVDLGKSVPKEDWAEVPKDLALNFDHYMYGAPREDGEG